MTFLIENWLLVLLALTSGAMLAWPAIQRRSGAATSVSTTEAVQLMNREKAVLIDVSEPAEYAAGHAAGARSVPLGAIASGHKGLPSNKALPLVIVCPNGTRAQRAVRSLRELGFQNVRTLGGGLAAWREANLPVERNAA